MVDVSSNHLNVTNPSSDVWDNRHDYDRNVIRKYAIGKFSDLLWASATHPAMMRYLNNADSVPPDFNENYGRELLELHTVGIDARLHRGRHAQLGAHHERFRRARPWPRDAEHRRRSSTTRRTTTSAPVTVMGFSHAEHARQAGGYAVGQAFVSYLAHHPATARRIADKLIARFRRPAADVRPSWPPPTWRRNRHRAGPQTAVLQRGVPHPSGRQGEAPAGGPRLLLPHAGDHPGPGQRAPTVCRRCGGSPTASATCRWPGRCRTGTRTTASTGSRPTRRCERWNLHMALAGQWWPVERRSERPERAPDAPGPGRSPTLLPSPLPPTYGAFVDAMAQRLVYQGWRRPARAAVLAFWGRPPTTSLKSTDAAVGWKLPYVVALILDSVYHALSCRRCPARRPPRRPP